MESIVALMHENMPCPVYARGADKAGERLVYNFNTTTFNGSRREARMKVHIYAGTMARGLELEKMLDQLLVRPGERALTGTVVSAFRNGGGWLEDGDGQIRIAYYDFVLRERQSARA